MFAKRVLTRSYFLKSESLTTIRKYDYCCLPGIKAGVEDIKPFDEIPGPRSLPIIGTIYKYVPYFGEYSFSRMLDNAVKLHEKYGKIVRMQILPGVNLVHAFDPDDIETIMRYSGKYPERRSHTALEWYRLNRPDKYISGGLLPTNGEKWWQIRSKFQKPLSSPKSAATYIGITNTVVSELIERIKTDYVGKENRENADFLEYLTRVNLQMILIIAFDAKYDTLSSIEFTSKSFSSKLIHVTEYINFMTMKLDYMPQFVVKYRFPNYRRFEEAVTYLESVAEDFIAKKMSSKSNFSNEPEKEPSLLEQYLSNPDIDMKDIIGMSFDLIIGGIDTTSYTTSFLLYHLAKNQDVQEKLYMEALGLLPNPTDSITSEVLSKIPYMRAVVKESLRIHPVSIGIGRTTTQDVVLSNYFVPKNTIAVTNNQVSGNLPEYIENPTKFSPERWLKTEENYVKLHPFLSIPFGHGSRMCIARRLAEQNIYIVVMKIIRNFQVKWIGEDLKVASTILNKPGGPVRLEFIPRN